MPIDPHVFDPVPMMTFSILPPPESCRVCGLDRRLCALTYKPRDAADELTTLTEEMGLYEPKEEHEGQK